MYNITFLNIMISITSIKTRNYIEANVSLDYLSKNT